MARPFQFPRRRWMLWVVALVALLVVAAEVYFLGPWMFRDALDFIDRNVVDQLIRR
jgi:hypothetical protein